MILQSRNSPALTSVAPTWCWLDRLCPVLLPIELSMNDDVGSFFQPQLHLGSQPIDCYLVGITFGSVCDGHIACADIDECNLARERKGAAGLSKDVDLLGLASAFGSRSKTNLNECPHCQLRSLGRSIPSANCRFGSDVNPKWFWR